MTYDIIIVGGGSAGCVLANRLSADPNSRVLLIEAGPNDRSWRYHTFVNTPKGFGKLLRDPKAIYAHATDFYAEDSGVPPQIMLRGRILGGSSAVNGMMYARGKPEDYAQMVQLGLKNWGWQDILPRYQMLEDNSFAEGGTEGHGGPVQLTRPVDETRIGEALIEAAAKLGLPRKDDPNTAEQLGIGYVASNIDVKGRRVSSARAFLPPTVRRRANLRILTNTQVDKLLFDGRRVVGARSRTGGAVNDYRANLVVVSCGALLSPVLLQRSGVGPGNVLRRAGVEVVHDLPGVGRNFRDHFNYYTRFRLTHARDSQNDQFNGWRLVANMARYLVGLRGPMAQGSTHLAAYWSSEEGKARPDQHILFSPYSLSEMPESSSKMRMAEEPTAMFYGIPLRPVSEGSIAIRSADPQVDALMRPNYLSAEYDRRLTVDAARFIRKLTSWPPAKNFFGDEIGPTAQAHTDDEIIESAIRYGYPGLHTVGTCKMGVESDPLAVLDERTRVRGVAGLHVVDASIFPEQLSANTNAPTMAAALHAADMIIADSKRL